MTEEKTTGSAPGDLNMIAKALVGVSIAPIHGPISQISTSGRDYKVHIKAGAGATALTKGSVTVRSGAVLIALPGTKVRANSGSVVIAYRDVEVDAKKGSLVMRVTPYFPDQQS